MSIREQPHYELPSSELAAWVEQQGPTIWWAVDGDPYLSSRVSTPCRGDELAAVLRRVNRPMLVAARDSSATGQPITRHDLDGVVDRIGNSIHPINPALPKPKWADDRCFWMCWKGETAEWLLTEDSEATRAFRDVVTEPLRIG